jgi:hypothetical protein
MHLVGGWAEADGFTLRGFDVSCRPILPPQPPGELRCSIQFLTMHSPQFHLFGNFLAKDLKG